MSENFVQQRVRVKTTFDGFQVGLEGVCTADLDDEHDVFAVLFDEPPFQGCMPWVSFHPNARKEHFELVQETEVQELPGPLEK